MAQHGSLSVAYRRCEVRRVQVRLFLVIPSAEPQPREGEGQTKPPDPTALSPIVGQPWADVASDTSPDSRGTSQPPSRS
jgi:hypothetical protein